VLSPVGLYPVAAMLSGAEAGNYVLAPVSGVALTIAKAGSSAGLVVGASSVTLGSAVSATVQVGSATSGTPTGSVSLLDGGVLLGTMALAGGSASYSSNSLGLGSHALTVVYGGDGNFVGSTSTSRTVAITPVAVVDFTLAATGATSQSVTSGSAASFTFAVQGDGLSSPITLAASGLPVGATASFNPGTVPPGGAVTAFTLTVQTPAKAVVAARVEPVGLKTFAGLALLMVPVVCWRRKAWGVLLMALLMVTAGCGDRITSTATAAASVANLAITVTGTATGAAGVLLQHAATVTLTVQ
jgi:hypothetical protein